MKNKAILLTIFFTIYSFQAKSADNCSKIIGALKNCTHYTCVADISSNKIEYEIFGLKEKNQCKFFEKDSSGVTICYISQNDINLVSNYLKSVLGNNFSKINQTEIEKFRFNKCYFYNKINDSLIKEEKELNEDSIKKIDYAVEVQRRKDTADAIKSIFFSQEDVRCLKNVSGKIKEKFIQEDQLSDNIPINLPLSTNNEGSLFLEKRISLDSIIYLSPNNWRIWINGKMFQNYINLSVTFVNANKVTFSWKPDKDLNKTNFTANGSSNPIEFTLYVGQVFYLDSANKNHEKQ